MRKKFVLGILALILAFSVILCGFSNFDGDTQDRNEETVYSLESTQAEPEPAQSETEQTEPESTEPELTSEPTQAEPESTEPELTPEPEPAQVTAPTQTNYSTSAAKAIKFFEWLQKPELTSEPTQAEPESTEPELTPEPEPAQVTAPTQTNYSTSVAKAVRFFEWVQEPEAMLWLDVMHRRFGIEEFADALQRFDQLYQLSDQPSVTHLFRRIADYNNPMSVEDFLRVRSSLDIITLPALYCDRLDLPSDYLMVFEDGVRSGGYKLTHVLLAWIWIQENGCELGLPDGFIEDMYHANAALIDTDPFVTDLEMEAAAFLCLAGQSELVDDSFLECVIANQDFDGGWGSNMRWHTTILGLLYLLHVEFPSNTYPPVLAPKPA